jgi:hypothetical protein
MSNHLEVFLVVIEKSDNIVLVEKSMHFVYFLSYKI